MNEANFLNSLSEQKYIAYYKWLRNSFFMFLLVGLSIAVVHFKQIYKINTLKLEKKEIENRLINFDDFIKEKSNLKRYRVEVQKQFEKLLEISSDAQRVLIFNFFNQLIKVVPDELYLQNFEFETKKGIFLKGHATESYIINDFMGKLNRIKLVKNVKLEYIRYKEFFKEEETEIDRQPIVTHEFFIKVQLKK